MAAPPPTCAHCGTPIVPGASFCQGCGAAVGPAPPPGTPVYGSTPLPSSFPPVPPPVFAPGPPGPPPIPYALAKDRDRSVTGLLLLVIGFALAWIPYVSILGELIALIGLIMVILGRRAYGAQHHRYVVLGGVLFLVTILATIALVIGFAAALIGQVSTNSMNGTVTFNHNGLANDLYALFVGAAVIGIIGGLAQVLLVYALADRTTRILLWLGFATSMAIALLVVALLVPQVISAVNQATSGSTFNSGPITSLENTSNLLGLAKVVPSLLFAWAYYRARTVAIGHAADPPS